MAEFDRERLAYADQARLRLASENRLSPGQARSFVRALQTSWHVPVIHWGGEDSDNQLDDAFVLIHAAEVYHQIRGGTPSEAVECYRRAGEILEWLARSNDDLKGIVPVELLSAACFQLGGQPAMAFGLLAQADTTSPGGDLFSLFLRGDFDGVLDKVIGFWARNEDLVRAQSSARILSDEREDSFEWYFTAEFVRCIGLISDCLRRGDDARLAKGIEKLSALEEVSARSFESITSLLITLVRRVAISYRDSSIFGPIRELASLNEGKEARVLRFARDQFSRGRGILWKSQLDGVRRLIESSSFALCTPTGSGKTLVANLALIKELMLSDSDGLEPLALYLVPSRALAGEVEAKLSSELGSDFIITGLYGGSDWGITDYWLLGDRPTVLIATVEKAEALMRYVSPFILSRLKLLIIDEAHQVVVEDGWRAREDFSKHKSRALRLEAFVSRLLARAPEVSRIALTAVAGGASGPVSQWIEGATDAAPVGGGYRSTRQIVGVLEAIPGDANRISLDVLNGESLFVRGRSDPPYLNLRTPAMPKLPAEMRNSINRYNQVNVLWTALHLVESDRRILISVAQSPEKTMKWFVEAMALPGWQEVPRFLLSDDEDARSLFEEARGACIDYCGAGSFELSLLERGIATNHGQMPQRLRRLMTRLIEKKICPIAVATATLTEGVNLPFDIILLPSITRSAYDRSLDRQIVSPMSQSEFRNLAGRAGRPGSASGLEGITLVAIPARPSTTSIAKLERQIWQIRQMRDAYRQLLEGLGQHGADAFDGESPLSLLMRSIEEQARDVFGVQGDDFVDWLDAALPGQISQEAGLESTDVSARLADSVDELDGVLLAAVEEIALVNEGPVGRADRERLLQALWQNSFARIVADEEAWMERAFIRRGNALAEVVYPDQDERRRLFQYGYSPFIARRFEAVFPAILDILGATDNFATLGAVERFEIFCMICDVIAEDRGFGLRAASRVSDPMAADEWVRILAWWLQAPGSTSPSPEQLRSWQRFVSDGIEFRLGVALGAVIARAWSTGVDNPFVVPSLAEWREITGLPWFAFWAREMLRWGTLEPFIAFVMSQGMAKTRAEGAAQQIEFVVWLTSNFDDLQSDDYIDPRKFLEWKGALGATPASVRPSYDFEAQLTGCGGVNQRYAVIPCLRGGGVLWMDAAGYELAVTSPLGDGVSLSVGDDYFLVQSGGGWRVRRAYRGAR